MEPDVNSILQSVKTIVRNARTESLTAQLLPKTGTLLLQLGNPLTKSRFVYVQLCVILHLIERFLHRLQYRLQLRPVGTEFD